MIIHANQEGVSAFERQTEKLLEILGHPEAFVTDLSQFLDFLSPFEYVTLAAAQARLDEILTAAGVTVHIDASDTFLEACRKIVADQPNWPDPPPVQ